MSDNIYIVNTNDDSVSVTVDTLTSTMYNGDSGCFQIDLSQETTISIMYEDTNSCCNFSLPTGDEISSSPTKINGQSCGQGSSCNKSIILINNSNYVNQYNCSASIMIEII